MTPLPAPVENLIKSWPNAAKTHVSMMRRVFWDVAGTEGVGPLEESLKWGQPSWRPKKPRTGSTLRLFWTADAPDQIAIYLNCQTDLAHRMLSDFPELFSGDGRRALFCPLGSPLPATAVAHLARATFTYHRKPRKSSG